MKRRLTRMSITKGFVILAFASISSLLVKTNLVYATVVYVDKSNHTIIILSLYPNAIDKNNITANQISSNMTATSNVHPFAARIQLLFFQQTIHQDTSSLLTM